MLNLGGGILFMTSMWGQLRIWMGWHRGPSLLEKRALWDSGTQNGKQDIQKPVNGFFVCLVGFFLRGRIAIAWDYDHEHFFFSCTQHPGHNDMACLASVWGWLTPNPRTGRGPCQGSDNTICRARTLERQPLPPSPWAGLAYLCV